MRLDYLKNILTEAEDNLRTGQFNYGVNLLKKINLLFTDKELKNRYYYLYGSLLSCSGKYVRSITYLRKALLLSPINSRDELYYYLIYTHLKMQHYDKARYYFHKMTEWINNPFYIFLIFYEFNSKRIQSDLTLDKLISLLSDDRKDIYKRLSFCIYQLLNGKPASALNILKNEDKIFKDLYFYNLILMKILFRMKKFEEIIKIFIERIIFLKSNELLLIYAASLYKLKFYDECGKVLEKILVSDKNNIICLINIARIMILKKNYIKAIMLLNKIDKKSVNHKNAIAFYISYSYLKLGLIDDFTKSSFKINRDSVYYDKFCFNMALTCYQLGYYKKAEEFYFNIRESSIGSDKYNKWIKIISENRNKVNKFNMLKIVIYLLPLIIMILSAAVLVIFFIIRGNGNG